MLTILVLHVFEHGISATVALILKWKKICGKNVMCRIAESTVCDSLCVVYVISHV